VHNGVAFLEVIEINMQGNDLLSEVFLLGFLLLEPLVPGLGFCIEAYQRGYDYQEYFFMALFGW